MKSLPAVFILAAMLIFSACSIEPVGESVKNPFAGRWIDLSHDFSTETIYWPTANPFKIDTVYAGHTEGGFYYSAYEFRAAEHGGTHLDAPVHFAEGRHAADEIPLDNLIGPAVVIRVIEQARADRNYQFAVADILAWEKRNGQIPDNCILLIDSGSSKFWPDKEKYIGTAERGADAVKKLKFPGIHPDAARFLVEKRKIRAVGLDTPSIDYGGSTNFESHQILYEKNIPGFENVANLDQMPEKGAYVVALPMKIRGGSGGPLRIVAMLPQN